MTQVIAVDQMRDRLLTLNDLRERLEPTEGLSEVEVDMLHMKTEFILPEGWNVGLEEMSGSSLTAASVRLNDQEHLLTKDTILEATSSVGLTMAYVGKTPGPLLAPHLNYWFNGRDKQVKFLMNHDGHGLAFTKGSISPFSGIRLVNEAVEAIQDRWSGAEVLVDYKLHHDLRRTAIRLIVPESEKRISSARASGTEDVWSTGIQISNSIVGLKPLSVRGYLFAWWCTNGATTTRAETDNYNRRRGQGDEAYEWARQTVDEVLGGLEHQLDLVEGLTTQTLEGDINDVLSAVFSRHRVPLAARSAIIAELVESDDLTAYGVMAAVTQAANSEDVSESMQSDLLSIGGELPHAFSEMCESCRRY